MHGLSVWIEGVREADSEADVTHIETEIEAVIAEALDGHPDIESGGRVKADYHADDQ